MSSSVKITLICTLLHVVSGMFRLRYIVILICILFFFLEVFIKVPNDNITFHREDKYCFFMDNHEDQLLKILSAIWTVDQQSVIVGCQYCVSKSEQQSPKDMGRLLPNIFFHTFCSP